jgi:hypothetical protein
MRLKIIAKTTCIPEDLSRRTSYRADKEDIDKLDPTRQLIKLGLKEYAVEVNKNRKISLKRNPKYLCK